MKKRGQITIFILLGMVILIIFGIVFFVSKSSSDLVLEKRINRIYGDFLRQSSIETFIQACMEQATKTGIALAALQGGRIYDTQVTGGYHLDSPRDAVPVTFEGTVLNVGYGIKAPSLLSTYPDGVPLKPNPEIELTPKFTQKRLFVKKEDNLLNPFSLPAICNFYGPNWWSIPNASFTCETQDFENDSIQEYLRIFIINRTKQCVSFSQFEQGQFQISEGDVQTQVALGNEDVFVSMRYPLEVSIRGQPPATRFLSFAYRPKIRVKKVYELATHLIGFYGAQSITKPPFTDGNNIFFNITNEDPNDCYDPIKKFNQPCVLQGMAVNKTSDYCEGNPLPECQLLLPHQQRADIVTINDTFTTINGFPLMFRFAIENRAPALGFIDEQKPALGDSLTIDIVARDPDEDMLLISLFDGSNSLLGTDGHEIVNKPIGDYQIKIESPSNGDLRVRVEDAEGLFDEQIFTVSIGSS